LTLVIGSFAVRNCQTGWGWAGWRFDRCTLIYLMLVISDLWGCIMSSEKHRKSDNRSEFPLNSFNLGSLTMRRDVSTVGAKASDVSRRPSLLQLDDWSLQAQVDQLAPWLNDDPKRVNAVIPDPVDFSQGPHTIYDTVSSAQGTGCERDDPAIWPILLSNDSCFFSDSCVSTVKRSHDCAHTQMMSWLRHPRLRRTTGSHFVPLDALFSRCL
jgi:hypothetical protein